MKRGRRSDGRMRKGRRLVEIRKGRRLDGRMKRG